MISSLENRGNSKQIFEIVEHLSKARNLITKQEEIDEMCQFSLEAGIFAKKSNAYAQVFFFLSFFLSFFQ